MTPAIACNAFLRKLHVLPFILFLLFPAGEKAKSQVAIRFKDTKGVELYDLTLRRITETRSVAIS